MKLYIAITTYNREQSFKTLLEQIEKNRGDYEIYVHTYDDCSDKNYRDVITHIDLPIEWFRFPRNNAKQGYWRVIDRVMQDASQIEFDYFFLLQDDCELVDGFFDEAIKQWNGILDKKKSTLCTFTPDNVYKRVMWGGRAEDVTFRGENYIKGGYVDCIFMCPRTTLERLSFQIRPVVIDWSRHPNQSSGVGMQMTKRLNDFGMTMYTCYNSLISTGKEKSLMNEDERKRNPLLPINREGRAGSTDMKFVGIASIPKRKDALFQVLTSLSPQVNKIFVSLNGYTEIPDWKFDNVEFTLTSNDMGDANKFLRVGEVQGYYFSCDDDIDYPADYVKKMIEKHQQYQGIITCHGRVVTRKVRDFYRDTTQHHFALRQHGDIKVHICGTGVSLFHTDEVAIRYEDFLKPNMADIWLGKFAQENGIRITCIERQRRWLKDIRVQEDVSIYQGARRDNSDQVSIVNSIKWN